MREQILLGPQADSAHRRQKRNSIKEITDNCLMGARLSGIDAAVGFVRALHGRIPGPARGDVAFLFQTNRGRRFQRWRPAGVTHKLLLGWYSDAWISVCTFRSTNRKT